MRGVMGQVQLSLSHKPVQALRRCATNNGCDCAPLGGHELGKVQQLFIFITGPLGLLDAGVEPLIPSGFALLGRLAHEQRGDTCPLIQAILHDSGLEDLILSIFPNTTLEDDPHPGLYAVLCSPEAAAATGGRKEALEGQARQTRTKHGNVVEE